MASCVLRQPSRLGYFDRPTMNDQPRSGWRLRKACLILVGALFANLYHPGSASATPPVGFIATTILHGALGEIDVSGKSIIPDSIADDRKAKIWLSQQQTDGPSDVYIQSNVWQPGGSTGWHIHPGRSLIVVKEGTVTEYEGHDPECKPHVYSKGMTFVDPGGEHVHIIRNEGDVVAQTTAVQLIRAGATRRVDVEDPGSCHF
jgi:quercetin dioxygenase-like cupin family protein